jgi:hypothetical protein
LQDGRGAALPSLRGVVVHAVTRAAIANARVVLVQEGNLTAARVADTNASGAFVFPDVSTGRYRLLAEHDDFARSALGDSFEVTPASPGTIVTIPLTPLGVIAGRVLDEHGEPAAHVYVRALIDARTAADTRTNDLGEYRLFGLAPARYVVMAERYLGPRFETRAGASALSYVVPTPPCPDCPGEGRSMVNVSVVTREGRFIDPRALTGDAYPPIYFPAALDREHATALALDPGATLIGIDLQLVRSHP